MLFRDVRRCQKHICTKMRQLRISSIFISMFLSSVALTLMYYVYLVPSNSSHRNQLEPDRKDNSVFIYEPGHKFTQQDRTQTTGANSVLGDYSVLLDAAKTISAKNKTVLVTLINDAYIPFTYSWLCNTKLMNIHEQVLIITSDIESADKLKKDWPEISVVFLKGLSSKGDQTYSHAGYVRLMIKRTEALLTLLENDIEMFLFEVDCYWLKNPLQYLQKNRGYDLLVNPVSERPGIIAGGFIYMFPTKATKSIWKALTEKLLKLDNQIKKLPPGKYISEGQNDQIYLSGLVHKKYGGIKTKILPLTEFADGKWYKFSEAKRKNMDPYVINNNWALGNKEKLTRAKKWGHWFIKEDFSCDMDQVKKIVKS